MILYVYPHTGGADTWRIRSLTGGSRRGYHQRMRILSAMYLLWAVIMLMAGPASAWAQDQTTEIAVAAPSNARQIDQSHQDFATYPLIVDRITQRGGIKGNIGATRTVEGALTRRTYRISASQTAAEIVDGYRRRLTAAGYDILYDCEGEACGAMFLRASPGYRAQPGQFDMTLAAQRYIAARKAGTQGDIYTAVQAADREEAGVAVQVDTLEVAPRKMDAIAVNAAQMARDLADKGRVVLYGIFFRTDSARIKPESRPTISEIAKLMRQEPDLKLLVVGHTDSRGSFDYNIDLSTRRASAVVDALVQDNDIDSDRLKPWGVGYSAPRASNDSVVGQAKNRRVELVAW